MQAETLIINHTATDIIDMWCRDSDLSAIRRRATAILSARLCPHGRRYGHAVKAVDAAIVASTPVVIGRPLEPSVVVGRLLEPSAIDVDLEYDVSSVEVDAVVITRLMLDDDTDIDMEVSR